MNTTTMNTTTCRALLVSAFTFAAAVTANAQISSTDLELWLRADVGVQTSGSSVTNWLDQSGQGNDASVPGGSSNPTLVSSQINGQPVVNFDSGTDRLQLATPLVTGATDFSVFAVVRSTSWAGEHPIGGNFGIGNFGGVEFYVLQSQVSYFHNPTFLQGGLLLPNQAYMLQADRNGSTVTLRLNDTIVATSSSAGGSIAGLLNWTIGNGTDNNQQPFGDMAEQIVYTRSLEANQSDRSLAVEYLFAKYSIPEPSALVLGFAGGLLIYRKRQK